MRGNKVIEYERKNGIHVESVFLLAKSVLLTFLLRLGIYNCISFLLSTINIISSAHNNTIM